MFDIEETGPIFAGFFIVFFAGYIIQYELSTMTFNQDAVAKIILFGSLVGAIIYYFRERNNEKSTENSMPKSSTVEYNKAKCDDSGHDSVVFRQRSLSRIKIKLNDRTLDEVQLPECLTSKSPIMVATTSNENKNEVEEDIDTSFYTPTKSAKSPEAVLLTLDPVAKWSNESATPIAFKKYKSSGNLDTLFENPVEDEEESNGSENLVDAELSIDCVEAVDMELDLNSRESLSIEPCANTSKKSLNGSCDSHEIVDMDIDHYDSQNEFLKSLELTPLKFDFDNMDISKSTDLDSTGHTDAPKLPAIPNVSIVSNLLEESFKFETSFDSCANLSLTKELSMHDELMAKNGTSETKNISMQTNSSRGDSAIGSEISEEDHQMANIRQVNSSGTSYFPLGLMKRETHVVASKPASHTTGSSFTAALNIHPNHQFTFNSSKIPVMKELEYRRTHLRSVHKND